MSTKDHKNSDSLNKDSVVADRSDEPIVATYSERGNQMVVRKSNQLIQLPVYKLSLMQQKLMLHIFAMIKPEDTELPEYEMTIYEFLKLCNLRTDSGSTYKYVKKALDDLANRKVEWINQPGTAYVETFRWIQKIRINPETGKIHIILDPILKPHLVQLKSFYTTMNITYTLPMKSQYSVHMYELLKSYQHFYLKAKQKGHPFVIEVDRLVKQLDAPYQKWTDIRRYILDRAKSEINGHTDIIFDYSIFQKGRKVQSIAVTIDPVSKEEAANTLIDIKSSYTAKMKRAAKNLLIDFKKEAQEDPEILSLSYVSAPETTIPYSFGPNKNEMVKELEVRAELDSLKNELTANEMEAIHVIIDIMAEAAGTLKPGEKEIDGANARIIEQINDVIIYCKSMKRWFAGIAARYANNIIPLSKTKSNPVLYLTHVIEQDLQNFKVYAFQKQKEDQQDVIDGQIELSDVVDDNEINRTPSTSVVYAIDEDHVEVVDISADTIKYTDAASRKQMIATLKTHLEYDQLISELSDGQKAALDDCIGIVANLCRRTNKKSDEEYVQGHANMQFISALNAIYKKHHTLKPFFAALAHEFDYSVFWTKAMSDSKIKNPKAYFAKQVEYALNYPQMTISAYESKQKSDQKKKGTWGNWQESLNDMFNDEEK